MPAVAVGYRVTDPHALGPDFLATVLLCEVLSDGDASRLNRRLVRGDQLVTDVGAYVGEFGDPFDERDPTVLTITAHYPRAESLPAILAGLDAEMARIATDGVTDDEVDRVRTRLLATVLREADSVLSRTLAAAKFELIFGSAEIFAALPSRFAAVTAADVQAAAARLTDGHRAIVELVPGGKA